MENIFGRLWIIEIYTIDIQSIEIRMKEIVGTVVHFSLPLNAAHSKMKFHVLEMGSGSKVSQ